MLRLLARIAVVGMFGLPGIAAHAGGGTDAPVWGVGLLPLDCEQTPCMTKGLFPLNPAARQEAGVIWFDQISPPPMHGPLRLLQEISAAYEAGRCLRVAGHFRGEQLTVLETQGDC